MSVRAVVLGAGVVGAACARALADGGADVRVIDPGAGRAAASWAAAGILSPSHPEELPEPLHALADRSLELWEGIARQHPRLELRRTGLTLLGDEPAWLAWREARGMACEPARWTGAGGRGRAAVVFPEVRVLRAHRAAPALLGDIPLERREAPPLDALRARADLVVVATGAWAAPWLAELGVAARVAPRRGQMLLFSGGDLPTIVMEPSASGLAVPRADGRVLVGGTVEDAGFDTATVAADLDRMEAWARATVPDLGAREDAWAGLRPWSDVPAPTIGVAAPGVVVAVGHFRNGILLAPATGELVADLALGREPRVPAAALAPRPC